MDRLSIGYCVTMGYSADDYATEHFEGFYDELLKLAKSEFLNRHDNIPENIKDNLEVPDSLEEKLKELYYSSIVDAYDRYEAELGSMMDEFQENFLEHELDEAENEAMDAIQAEFVKQFKGKKDV